MNQETELVLTNCSLALQHLGQLLETGGLENRELESTIDKFAAELSMFSSSQNPDKNISFGRNLLLRIRIAAELSNLIIKMQQQVQDAVQVVDRIYDEQYQELKESDIHTVQVELDRLLIDTTASQLPSAKLLEKAIAAIIADAKHTLCMQRADFEYHIESGYVRDAKSQQQLRNDFKILYQKAKHKFGDTCEQTVQHLKDGKDTVKSIDESMRFEASMQYAQQQAALQAQQRREYYHKSANQRSVSCCLFMFKGADAFNAEPSEFVITAISPPTSATPNALNFVGSRQNVQSRLSITKGLSLRKFSLLSEGSHSPNRIKERLALLHGKLAKIYADVSYELDNFDTSSPTRSNNNTPVPVLEQ